MKLYVITRYSSPLTCGAANKMSWRSKKWVTYHLQWLLKGKNTENLWVHEVNLGIGTITKYNAQEFFNANYVDRYAEREIERRFGFKASVASLKQMYDKRVFRVSLHDGVKEFLTSKGINC